MRWSSLHLIGHAKAEKKENEEEEIVKELIAKSFPDDERHQSSISRNTINPK